MPLASSTLSSYVSLMHLVNGAQVLNISFPFSLFAAATAAGLLELL